MLKRRSGGRGPRRLVTFARPPAVATDEFLPLLEDPRVTALMEGEQIAHMEQMRYGGFQTFVSV